MKSFKLEDIQDLRFRHYKINTDQVIYTIDFDKNKNECLVKWTDQFSGTNNTSSYRPGQVLLLLNQRKWIPINTFDNYEIF